MHVASRSARLLVFSALMAAVGVACERGDKGGLPLASVQGRAGSALGRPLPRAKARLEPRAGTPSGTLRESSADLDGVFKLEGVPPGSYDLRVLAPGYADVLIPVQLAAHDDLRTVVRLEPAQLLEGQVLDARGRPLPDALVLAWPTGEKGTLPPVEARSAADGRFVLAGVSRGAWTLFAEAPGFGALHLERVEVPARQLVLKLEGESRRLTGSVQVPGGQPVPGARVSLAGPSVRAPRETTTDARGAFSFAGLGQGRFVLRATTDKLSSLPVAQVIDDRTGALTPLALTLAPAGFFAGIVVDDRGAPLAEATVELIAEATDGVGGKVKVGQGGRFRLGPLPPGSYQLIARRAGHVPVQTSELRLTAGAMPIELRLHRGARLLGRVVDEKGRALVGASVVAVPISAPSPQDLSVVKGSLPPAAEAAGQGSSQAPRPGGKSRGASTGHDGRFELDDVSPGRTRIEVSHPDKLPLRREPVEVAAGAAKDVGDLALQAGGLLRGRVVDEEGHPLPGAHVEARRSGSGSAPALRAEADANGGFSLRAPAGEYALVAQATGRAAQSLVGVKIGAGTDGPLELRLNRASGVLEGEVRDPRGRPVGRVAVVAYAADAPAGSEAVVLASTMADGAGRFKLAGLTGRPLRLELRHPDWPTTSMQLQPGETRARLSFTQPGGIEGEVRAKPTGAFVNRYQLRAIGPDGRLADKVKTQGAGFEIHGLVPGRWQIEVNAPGYAPASLTVEVPPGQDRRQPSVRNLRLELNPASAVARP